MTDSAFHGFVMSGLRVKHTKWGPANRVKSKARVRRGYYLCAHCKQEVTATIPAIYKSGKKEGLPYKMKNALVDHIEPVIDPAKGFEGWSKAIKRMFLEEDGYQLLCHECHQVKCNEERAVRNSRKEKQ